MGGKMSANCDKEGEISYALWPNDRKGAEGQTRTVDTGIFSAVLYHLSYLGEECLS